MPKLKTDPDVAAREALQTAVRVQLAQYGMYIYELGQAIGLSGNRCGELLAKPDSISLGRMRLIIRTLRLDPGVMLKFLGYDDREIKRFKAS